MEHFEELIIILALTTKTGNHSLSIFTCACVYIIIKQVSSDAVQTCIRVFTTSMGVFPNTLAAPAMPPIQNVLMLPISLELSPSWKYFFRLEYTKKRMAWLDPCFRIVGVRPL